MKRRQHLNSIRCGFSLRSEQLENRWLLAADIQVEVTTNGFNVDAAPGPQVFVDDSITWNYEVTNNGTESVHSVQLRDDAGTQDIPDDDFSPLPVSLSSPVLGTVEKTYENLPVIQSVFHPTRPYLYASAPSINTLAIINTSTLELEATILISGISRGIAISNDGTRLYITTDSYGIQVFDTQARQFLYVLQIDANDLEVGADGQLFVLTDNTILQIDPESGDETGTPLNDIPFVYGGLLEISPQKDRLYYGNTGLSPASLYQFDLTTGGLLWQNPFDSVGSNGGDLRISHDGSFISYVAGMGPLGYSIAKYRTSDMTIVGTFDTGPYPFSIAFSTDDEVAYTPDPLDRKIDVWDVNTFSYTGRIDRAGEVIRTFVDRADRHLFAATPFDFKVYGTGRGLPYNIGDGNRNDLLDPGETWKYVATAMAKSGPYTSVARLTAMDQLNGEIIQHDSSHYHGLDSRFAIASFLNGSAATESSHPIVYATSENTWQYEVSLSGQRSVAHVNLIDDGGTPLDLSDDQLAVLTSGDTNQNEQFDPGEQWRFRVTSLAKSGAWTHLARVTGIILDEMVFPAKDAAIAATSASGYFGASPMIDLQLDANGTSANSPPGVSLFWKDPIEWDYTLTNTGNVPLTNVMVTDDHGTDTFPFDDFAPQSILAPPIPRGTLLKTYPNLAIEGFALDPTRSYLYAADFGANSVVVINTKTLELEEQIPVGAGPRSLAMSNDGSYVYVSSDIDRSVSVINTIERKVVARFAMPGRGFDIEVGVDGRLFVSTDQGIRQMNPTTGLAVGPVIGTAYGGELEISPQKDRLYYAYHAYSDAELYLFDLTSDPPTELRATSHSFWGGAGAGLSISHDGLSIAYTTGGGDSFAKYSAIDLTLLGEFETGVAKDITFSIDDAIAYTAGESEAIRLWDAATFSYLGAIQTSGRVNELSVDTGGEYLFAAFDGYLNVYHTGKYVPLNIGDLGRDNILDPGESWLYRAGSLAEKDQQVRLATAYALDPLSGMTADTAAAYYFGITQVEVLPGIGGKVIATLSHPLAAPDSWHVSDDRFEVIGNQLKLKADVQLSIAEDDGLIVEVGYDGPMASFVSKFVLHVVPDVSSWHNQIIPEDVNQDGQVLPHDILLLIDNINREGSRELYSRTVNLSPPRPDVNGDGFLTPHDLLLIIDRVNRQVVQQGFLAADDGNGVESPNVAPQVSSGILARTTDDLHLAPFESKVETPKIVPGALVESRRKSAQAMPSFLHPTECQSWMVNVVSEIDIKYLSDEESDDLSRFNHLADELLSSLLTDDDYSLRL